jgi:hypothetical protein
MSQQLSERRPSTGGANERASGGANRPMTAGATSRGAA